MLPKVMRTARLVLRPPRLEDRAAIFESYGRDPEVTRYLAWRPHTRVEEMDGFVRRSVAAWRGNARRPWVLTRPPEDGPIGMLELRLSGHQAELGYVLARAAWGQGLMTEAVQAVVDLALAEPGLYRTWAVCDVENLASARVLEKAGMQREGLLRRYVIHPNLGYEPRDALLYARVR
jgi:RimJ/RimL family protein N-acetyltransferase